jgi:hypothetical protein
MGARLHPGVRAGMISATIMGSGESGHSHEISQATRCHVWIAVLQHGGVIDSVCARAHLRQAM